MAKFVNNQEEFFKYCEDEEVLFVDFRFTDMIGAWHHITYKLDAVDEQLLNEGIPFDGSSLKGWQPIEKSDMVLKPDVKSAFLDPFSADPSIIVICDVYDIYEGEFYAKCPRSIAKKAYEHMKSTDLADAAHFGAENEFFIFDDVKIVDSMNCSKWQVDSEEGEWNDDKDFIDSYNTAHRPRLKGGYFPVSPVDSQSDIRAEIVNVLERVGLKTFVHHHEVAQAQGEVGVVFDTLVEAADNVQIYKYVVKMVAHLNGKTATFMPKPLYGDNGNGMHVNMSLSKDGVNLFYDASGYAKISQMATHYIGGILGNARSVAAFTNASSNSYKRIVPGFEAPCILTYSSQNRSASCRIPYGINEKSARVEIRFPDSTANPYLAFATLLLAGLDGIAKKTVPVGPMDENLFALTLDEIRAKGIEQLPHTLRGSLESLIRSNEFLRPAMSEKFLFDYQELKFKTQVFPVEARPTAYEFKTCYSC